MLDHDALFRSLHAVLRPGGRLAAQNGGAGNISRLKRSSAEVAARDPYAAHFEGFGEPWNYAGAGGDRGAPARRRLRRGACWLQPWDVIPPEPAEFLRTVCLGPHMDRLPEELRDPFVADVLALEDDPLVLDYVRLNIDAALT